MFENSSQQLWLKIVWQHWESLYADGYHRTHADHSGAETEMFQDNWVSPVAADALPPCITMASTAMVFTECNTQVLVFNSLRPSDAYMCQ